MTAPRSNRASIEFQRATVAYSVALRDAMHRRGVLSRVLAEAVGVSRNAVCFYREGRYLPRPDVAGRIAEYLDAPELHKLASSGRRIRCVTCGRTVLRGKTRRRYCSAECWRAVARNPPLAENAERAAIDAYCRGCEPEGVCRTPACPLQPFSPLPLVELTRAAAW